MPTIKLNGGNVLIKNGKASCACCDAADCCMYPAEGLGDTYEVEDLPDAVTLVGNDESIDAFKVDPPDSGPDYLIYYRTATGNPVEAIGTVYDFGDGPVWYFANEDDFSPVTGQNSCLIRGDGNLTPGDDTVEDQFEDCYEVEIVVGDRAGTYTVIRRSLCDWSSEVEDNGEPAGVKLYYLNELGAPIWEIDFSVGYRKDGNSSSPEGEYQGGDAIVTEITCP
jgi:hypothetical protein